MKEIIRKREKNVIDLESLFSDERPDRLPENGIIAYIYNGKVSVLTYFKPYNPSSNQTSAFWMGGDSFHTASQTSKEVVTRALTETTHKMYWFEDWADFAKNVVENSWK